MESMNLVNMEDWQKERIDFYINSGALKFIEEYFNVKKGVRCIVGHLRNYPSKKPVYYEYGRDDNKNLCRAITLPDHNKDSGLYNNLVNFNCVHSLIDTFNISVLEWMDIVSHRQNIVDNVCGLNLIIELDAPYDSLERGAKRLNFFDFIDEFNRCVNIIGKYLDDVGEEYNIMFSGNGIYIMLEGFYEIDSLLDYKENFIRLMDNIKEDNSELDNPIKVHIDNKSCPWNDYFKIPFTFHEKRPRISIPLSKDEIDGKWLNEVSDISNIFVRDNFYDCDNFCYDVINEVISKCEWRKIW